MTLVIYSDLEGTGQEQFMLVEGTVEQVQERFQQALTYGQHNGCYYENDRNGFDVESIGMHNFTFKSLTGAPAIQKVFKDFLGESFGSGVLPQILSAFQQPVAEI